MRTLLQIAAIATVCLGGADGTLADELPTFEREGMPITPHQVQIVGSNGVHEQPPCAPVTLGGMPASPHQLAVLRPTRQTTH